jgi:hypothetical protein
VQLVPFYHTSNKEGGMGKYFGTNNKNTLKIDVAAEGTDIQNSLIVHQKDSPSTLALRGNLTLKPRHTTYGAYLSYNQELNNIQKGLYIQLGIPLVHVENDLHPTVTNERKTNINGEYQGIMDFFTGCYTNNATVNTQSALTHAKLRCGDGKSGIADVELTIGYKFAEKEDHLVCGNINFVFPTGNKSNGEYLFPAIVGNGRHWGVGFSFNGSMNITRSKTSSLEFLFDVDYRYLFKNTQKRTIGFRNGLASTGTVEDTAVIIPWDYYVLGGEHGRRGLFPLANVLTRDVSVYPGGRLNGHVSFAYHQNNTTIDFGYSLFAQEGEKVNVGCWEDNKYAPASITHDTTNAFDASHGSSDVIGGPIAPAELNPHKAETPAVFKSSAHAGISYTLSEWDNPFMLGCGFSIDWTHDNSNPTGYTLWAKVGVSF